MYWDAEKSTYLPAPTSAAPDTQAAATMTASLTTQEVAAAGELRKDDEQKKPPTPEKKVKVAKKIIKANKLCLVCYNSTICKWWLFVDHSKCVLFRRHLEKCLLQ